jgi:hypothetical protein
MPTNNDNSYGRYPNGSATLVNLEFPTPYLNNDISGLDDNMHILQPLVAYPNPSSDVVYFNKKIDFKVYDLTGRVVKVSINEFKLDASQLSEGIYIVKTSEKEVIKVIINKK